MGWTVAPQPPNSPDTNVLGFFAAIQSLQDRKSTRTIDELVGHETSSFDEYPHERLNHTFMSLQACLIETMIHFGDNAYKLPHMSKEKHERKGMLPLNVSCPCEVFDAARSKLDGISSADLDRALAAEMEEVRCINELAQELEAIALCDDESDDMLDVMIEVGIESICVEDDE
ncbi:hypothetical protein AaE_009963 [Aphanomyces astaci]|uniref:Uncharacterized protein n=1 Tax=Aphanomyces astaci TaxID=112090 RepID=A0A6A4ZR54_APHAT|nr:hypothetical protein AaE_009963 [Aphanomyces astaci]